MPKNKIFPILSIFAIIVPFIIAVTPIIGSHINFWYDPARDLLLAWDNLKKPALIGVPTGIPGLFYGPYWIWFLSAAMFLTKDPRLILFLVITLPYFIIVPFIFFKLSSKWLGRVVGLATCLLFLFFYLRSYNQIWNPNLAPLIFIIELYVLYASRFWLDKPDIRNWFMLGLIQGLLLNFHISFGLGILVSIFFYFAIELIWNLHHRPHKQKILINWVLNIFFFSLALLLVFTPFFLFEARHGFNQIKILIYTLSQSFLHNAPVVGQIGLTKMQIFGHFIARLTDLFNLPSNLSIPAFVLFAAVLCVCLLRYKKLIHLQEAKLVLILILNGLGILTVYLTSRNPVWDYHFIGVEIIYLFLAAFLMKHSRSIRILGIFCIVIVVLYTYFLFVRSFRPVKLFGPDLSTEKTTVIRIFKDANGKSFAYAANNQAIYTYEYDYLFKWLGVARYHFVPANQAGSSSLVYLIIPRDRLGDKVGFVLNRTPDNLYKTVGSWYEQDGSLIIKRQALQL